MYRNFMGRRPEAVRACHPLERPKVERLKLRELVDQDGYGVDLRIILQRRRHEANKPVSHGVIACRDRLGPDFRERVGKVVVRGHALHQLFFTGAHVPHGLIEVASCPSVPGPLV
jgi:hypothetical protein